METTECHSCHHLWLFRFNQRTTKTPKSEISIYPTGQTTLNGAIVVDHTILVYPLKEANTTATIQTDRSSVKGKGQQLMSTVHTRKPYGHVTLLIESSRLICLQWIAFVSWQGKFAHRMETCWTTIQYLLKGHSNVIILFNTNTVNWTSATCWPEHMSRSRFCWNDRS